MESDQAIQENSEQVSDDKQGASQAAKSYECTFCKRGFSNAQALGGHMNIHRKDKAKLKQVSSSNTIETKQHQQQQRLLDIPKMPSSYSSPILPTINSSEHNKLKPSHDAERNTSTWPWFLNKEGDATMRHNIDPNHLSHQVQQQLPLFSQAPSQARVHENPGLQQAHGDQGLQPSGSELDLELRLGPERQDSSSKANTTRKFF
ncbi:PREDICTED: probable transcriptional regulator RABBIT EARS [Prunus mume]|uniref:Probable transcriptional regulator RABBIT EARS n=1 Tax=Prunus mume TaxID=102107 RepID=A0ABM0NAX4_PRUMU|nr:PREDICTED: probable transcriptional regulator RABBIT EARS [Prunus mume]